MEGFIFLGSLILIFVSFILFENSSRRGTIKYMLENGKCKRCGSDNSTNTRFYVSNKHYHDSRQDVICEFKCTCESEMANTFCHLYHNKARDKYLYNLAIKFINNELPWQEEYEAKGHKVWEQIIQRKVMDKQRAKELGL